MKIMLQIWVAITIVYAVVYFTEGNIDAFKEALGSIIVALVFIGYIHHQE